MKNEESVCRSALKLTGYFTIHRAWSFIFVSKAYKLNLRIVVAERRFVTFGHLDSSHFDILQRLLLLNFAL